MTMISFRTIAVALSLMFHASVGYAMLPRDDLNPIDAFDVGTGNDQFVVEQGIAIEGIAKLGDDLQTIEMADVTPVAQEVPPPVNEVKPVDELRDTITSAESKIEDNIVKTEDPPPPVTPPPTPQVVQAQEQPQQVAIAMEQSSGEAKKGAADPAIFKQYLGKLSEFVQKAKINPRSKLTGTVWVKFKVSPEGELLSREITSSSGSKVLDEAAVAALDRAAPFPPMPQEVANGPVDVSVPFKFVTR
jgi:periplasmic protein TonB